jgi:rhodanese-related sulfurtransferase
MRRIAEAIAGPTICAVFVLTMLSSALSADVPRITKEELRTWIDKGDVIVVDVRIGRDWKSSEYKIHTAVREDPDHAASWAKKYDKDKTLVLYCA